MQTWSYSWQVVLYKSDPFLRLLVKLLKEHWDPHLVWSMPSWPSISLARECGHWLLFGPWLTMVMFISQSFMYSICVSPGLYCSGDWTTMGGWKHKISKPATMPYEESYPKKNPRWERGEPWMYGAQGFDKNKIELKTSTTPYHSWFCSQTYLWIFNRK